MVGGIKDIACAALPEPRTAAAATLEERVFPVKEEIEEPEAAGRVKGKQGKYPINKR